MLFEKCVLSGSSIRVSYLSGESAFDLTSLRPPVCLIHDYKIKMGGGGVIERERKSIYEVCEGRKSVCV